MCIQRISGIGAMLLLLCGCANGSERRLKAISCEIYDASMAMEINKDGPGLQILMFDATGIAFHLGGKPFSKSYAEVRIRKHDDRSFEIRPEAGGEKSYFVFDVDKSCMQWMSARFERTPG